MNDRGFTSAILLVFILILAPAGTAQDVTLDDVTHWLYLIDVNLDADTVEQISESAHDMIVIDFISSEAANIDYPLANVIETWHAADHPKLVLAYIDVGQAESYRTYWQPDWGIGEPEWILSEDPDGWAENFPVAYWYDEWRAIWLAEGGYLEQIAAAGFDGVYLDWVEAYDDNSVIAFAEQDGVDPVEEMIWWVQDIAEGLREHNPDAMVIAQNAAELAVYDDYVAVINAIAQGQVWFDGGADNDPPGDCPLPRTETDISTTNYIESLSPPCRQQYETFTDSTLYVSSEWYIEDLQVAQEKGLAIFTVDYALEPENVAWVYAESRSLGFIPFVSNRGLDTFRPIIP
jgi:cysteinyl-tRNA synthetase